jgi:hypothetical protein
MKKYTLLFIVILSMQTEKLWAQPIWRFKFKSNPAYSIFNYKQADRAALAKKYRLQKESVLQYEEKKNGSNLFDRNYKKQITSRNSSSADLVSLRHTDSIGKSWALNHNNYKRQNLTM